MEMFITVRAEKSDAAIWEIGKTIMLKKECADEQIGVYMPMTGKAGVVANDRETMVKGTFSASRIYDAVSAVFHGRVMFVLEDRVIVKLVIEEKKEEIRLFDIGGMRKTTNLI